MLYYNAALEDLRTLITEVQAHRQVEIELGEASDEVETFREEVDYWTDGRLSAHEQKLKDLEQQLKDGEQTLTTEQIKQLAEQIDALSPELAEIAEYAKMQVILSIMREDIADALVKIMESDYGYQIDDPNADVTYEGSDRRNAFVVKVKNIAGDEVVTVISPEKEFGANNVSINTFSDRLHNDAELGQRAERIFDALHEEVGLELKGETKIHVPKEEYQDIEQVRRRIVNRSQTEQRFSQGST
ncbi:MAG: hypothetical protein GDA43_02575 [Hormoscilla sp. SP5CHS1]|nr:hypothetical protein [Hormoscilla sp. SP5CHS1]